MSEYTCVVEGVIATCNPDNTIGQVQALGILDPFVGLVFVVSVVIAVSLGVALGYIVGGGHR